MKTEIRLIVWDYPAADWDAIGHMLLPTHERIENLTIRSIYDPSLELPSHTTSRYIRTLSKIFGSLNSLPGLKYLEFDRPLEFSASQLQSLQLHPGVCVTSPVEVVGLVTNSEHIIHNRVSNSVVHERFDVCLAVAGTFPSLRTLNVADGDLHSEDELSILSTLGPFSHFTSLTFFQPYISIRLVQTSAYRLTYLSLRITSSWIENLLHHLGLIINLQHLALYIIAIPNPLAVASASYHAQVPSLQTLDLQIYGFYKDMILDVASPFSSLFVAFTILYPDSTAISISGISLRAPYVGSYVQSLSRVDSLSCRDAVDHLPYMRTIILPSLTKLSLDNPDILQHIRAPNLLCLEVFNMMNSSQFERLSFPYLLKLSIHLGWTPAFTYSLNPFKYPELKELTIDLGLQQHIWIRTALSHLTSITIMSDQLPAPQGSILCVELIYYPDSLPSLRELRLNDFVDWNILFFMLKRRNFGLVGIQRIDSFSLPFIPFQFRQYLSFLLGGGLYKAPPKPSLSLETTRRLVCDPEMPGCVRCLKYGCPSCFLTNTCEENISGNPKDIGSLFPDFADPPSAAPAEVTQWGVWLEAKRLLAEEEDLEEEAAKLKL
ncbi:hypothetical protein M408DRAFT_22510 [Serendipita vermifera MAFF 305830]|uniref:Uncharacterized protein n=1 Tax=Serendipita vermifera MAFF 305830 TaxID=933852 RepID=A0A0C3BFA2_SERVB|nr:hypothetical protein M408DRAFT_22510 [Serendipita vermifera MAFF 305830]